MFQMCKNIAKIYISIIYCADCDNEYLSNL